MTAMITPAAAVAQPSAADPVVSSAATAPAKYGLNTNEMTTLNAAEPQSHATHAINPAQIPSAVNR